MSASPKHTPDPEARRRLGGFLVEVAVAVLGSFLLWLLPARLLPRVTSLDDRAAGLLGAVLILALMTAIGVGLHMKRRSRLPQSAAPRGDSDSAGRPADTRLSQADYRALLGLILTWAGSLVAYYFLVYSQGLPVIPAVLLIHLLLLAGHVILRVLPWELTLYLFFGVLTTLVSYGTFALADRLMNGPDPGVRAEGWAGGLSWIIPQAISFTAAMLFAYPTNRRFVFHSRGPVVREFVQFVGSRIVMTLIFEVGAFYIFHNLLRLNRDLTKIVTALLVTIANYVASKWYIFKDRKQGTDPSA